MRLYFFSIIFILGFVEKIQPLMNRMKLSVAPLRYGAGLKGKVGASMASGLPVVVSGIAAEGFNATNQKDILLAKLQSYNIFILHIELTFI